MDALLSNYGSSDEEEEKEQQRPKQQEKRLDFKSLSLPPSISNSIFSSLPKPSSGKDFQIDNDHQEPNPNKSSFFSSIPNRESSLSSIEGSRYDSESKPDKASIFSLLPKPKSSDSSAPAPRKVVKFTPPVPINPRVLVDDDDDDDDDDKEKTKQSEDFSTGRRPGFLSSMLPVPKNATLGSAATASRISIGVESRAVNTEPPTEPEAPGGSAVHTAGTENYASYENYGTPTVDSAAYSTGTESYTKFENYGSYENYTGYENYTVYENHGNYDGYENYNWGSSSDGSTAMPVQVEIPEMGRIGGKRGRSEIPAEIVEVKQEELIKNRPRPDQTKLTGIAFGPTYQPGPSAKEKPSKLLRRKHQIGSLYYDMRQKEMELAERRSRGLLTKAETQAKYGW